MRLLALYAADVGAGQPHASRGAAYLALLRSRGLARYAVPTRRLALDRRVADWCFELPAVLLAMSRQPEEFTPEIAGADLCLRTVGPLPALAALDDVAGTALDPGSARHGARPGGELSGQVADALAAGGEGERVTSGFAWALGLLADFSARLRADLASARDPAYEMAELLRARSREACAYHQDYQLGGRPLAGWLRDARTDPAPLLTVLAGSKLVRPGRPDASPLLGSLISARGPMFRVFAPEDLAVIRRWISSLPGGPDPAGPAAGTAPAGPVVPLAPPARPEAGGAPPASLREAYCQLLARTDTPALRRYADDYVRSWLARAYTGLDEGETRLPAGWDDGGLRPWLAEQHDRHDAAFAATASQPVPSREDVIESTVQLAPLTLIDGSWLQGFTDYWLASSGYGHFLFETYWDELGNGEPPLNHPLIYRQVLAEMGVAPPPTRSREFAFWDRFAERSFELPVYWLCIGRFPATYLPEILGLNLAMELSGVGGTYRRAHQALREHGFSTRFVDIHNTIDNVATGHSAWAADAVDTYLAEMTSLRGADALPRLWERIRAGFRSLDPPADRRARRAARRARPPANGEEARA